MGKKHRQPQVAARPATSTGKRERDSDVPKPPPPPAESSGDDEQPAQVVGDFEEMSDLGSQMGGSDSSEVDQDSDDESSYDDDEDVMFFDEGDHEESDDDSDMVDDEYDTAQVDFDVNAMNPGDVDIAFHMMDAWVPDENNFVDRDAFGEALAASPHTSLVTMSAAEAKPSDDDNDVVGLMSILDLARKGGSNKALANLLTLFSKPLAVVSPGMTIDTLCGTKPFGKGTLSKAVLVVNERIKNLPIELAGRLVEHTFTSFQDDMQIVRQKMKKGEALTADEDAVAATEDCIYFVAAKIQRSQESLGEKGDKSDEKQKKKKRSDGFNIEDFVFWREEDEHLFKQRTNSVACATFKCRAQYDLQPEAEVPITLLFGVTKEGAAKAIESMQAEMTLPVQ